MYTSKYVQLQKEYLKDNKDIQKFILF